MFGITTARGEARMKKKAKTLISGVIVATIVLFVGPAGGQEPDPPVCVDADGNEVACETESPIVASPVDGTGIDSADGTGIDSADGTGIDSADGTGIDSADGTGIASGSDPDDG